MTRLIGLLLLISAILLMTTPVALAQTTTTPTPSPTPTPTPTPTSTLPAGMDLLNQMNQAVTAKNTFHEVLTVKLSAKQNAKNHDSETVQAKGDESLKPVRLHELATVTGSSTTKGKTQPINEHDALIIVGKKAATRRNGGAWTCASASTLLGGTTTSSAPTTSDIVSATNLGADTIDNVAVWHVQAQVNLGGTSGPVASTVPADYYISQADMTLVRARVSLNESILGVNIKETSTVDYSQYGKTIKSKLPAACKKS